MLIHTLRKHNESMSNNWQFTVLCSSTLNRSLLESQAEFHSCRIVQFEFDSSGDKYYAKLSLMQLIDKHLNCTLD